VSCPSDTVRKRVEAVLDMAITTVSSLTESFATGVSIPPEDVDPKQQKSISPDGHTDVATVEDTMTTGEADIASR
jgi:cleavage and polyadenylation specificity factor subunit 3